MIYTQHPLSAAFPAMSDEDLKSLADDIRVNRQHEPINAIGDQILDGWHRYKACQMAGVDPEIIQFLGSDPVKWVLSANLHRRHLTASQRAAAVVACHNWKPQGRPEIKPAAAAGLISSERQMAQEAEVSERTIRDAKRAHEAGLGDAVKSGAVSAERAAQVAKLPEAERQAALADPSPRRKAADRATEKLQRENEALREQLEATGDAIDMAAEIERENQKLRILQAGDTETNQYIDTLHQQIKQLEYERDRAFSERDRLMTENAELVREVKKLRRALDRNTRKAA